MSAICNMSEASDPADGARQVFRRPVGLIKTASRRVRAVVLARRAGRQTFRRLASLDDRMLRDIGINPATVRGDPGDLRGIADVIALLSGPKARRH